MFELFGNNKGMSKDDSCPKCGSEGYVESYISVLLSFERADLAITACLVVFICGIAQQFSLDLILVFAAMAVAPVFVHIRRKKFCERCEIDFISELKKQPRS